MEEQFKWSLSRDECSVPQEHHHPCSLASSVCAIRETAQDQGNVVLLVWVVYSEDNLHQNNKQKKSIVSRLDHRSLQIKCGHKFTYNTASVENRSSSSLRMVVEDVNMWRHKSSSPQHTGKSTSLLNSPSTEQSQNEFYTLLL